MTTAEFIEILKKEDPEGTAHIRMSGGVPKFAERKPGYWDGAYSYINDKGQFVNTTKGTKVDIHCVEADDLVWDNHMDYCPYKNNKNEAWEKLKTLYVLDYNYVYEDQRIEKEKNFLDGIEKSFNEYIEYEIDSSKMYLEKVIEKARNGWKFFQKKDGNKWYDWVILDENDKKENGTNIATSEPILLSGQFVSYDRDEFIEWILKTI